MLYSVAVLGVGIGIGTSVLIYHLLRHWLRPPPDLDDHVPVSPARPDVALDEDASSVVDHDTAILLQERRVWSHSRDGFVEDISKMGNTHEKTEGLRHRQPVMLDTDGNHISEDSSMLCALGHSRFEAPVDSDFIETPPQIKLNNNTAPAILLRPSSIEKESMDLPNNVENWSFSMNAEVSHSDQPDSGRTSSVDSDPQYPSVILRKPRQDECSFRTNMHKYLMPYTGSPDQNYSFSSLSFSPSVMSCQHSTPDDQQMASMNTASGVEPTNLESIFMYDAELTEKGCALNTFSLHDFSHSELRRSRSCVSLDESMFLSNEFALIESPCAIDVCSAVTNLEQLEREVAGVLSDCGDMERCVGVLRRHDRHDRVAKRYSLGVADSVIAGDLRLFEMGPRDLSVLSEAQNSSVGVVNCRDSGYIWDDELLELESAPISMNGSTLSRKARSTRSLSPPCVSRHLGNARSSICVRANGQDAVLNDGKPVESGAPHSSDNVCSHPSSHLLASNTVD